MHFGSESPSSSFGSEDLSSSSLERTTKDKKIYTFTTRSRLENISLQISDEQKALSLPVYNTEVCYPSQPKAVCMKVSVRSSFLSLLSLVRSSFLSLLSLCISSSKLLDSQKRQATKYLLQQQQKYLTQFNSNIIKTSKIDFLYFQSQLQNTDWNLKILLSALFIKYKMLCTLLD